MRPTSAEILRGIVANLEEMILPQLEGAHAQSACMNAMMLLEHVIVRLEDEGATLAADNAEKRAVLTSVRDGTPPALHSAADDVIRRTHAVPQSGAYVSIAALTAENEALKAVMDDWVAAIHAAPELDPATSEALRGPLRGQLRAQIDREARLVAPISLGKIFWNRDA